MRATKPGKGTFSPEALEMVAARFRALGEPLRLLILQELEAGEKSVRELTEAISSTQPNVSKHLKILQEAGLLARRQERNTVYYAIADASTYEIIEIVCVNLRGRLAIQSEAMQKMAGRAARRK
jgi:DNA-binding transcriptional ArsR family regulator